MNTAATIIPMKASKSRIAALDIMRGITIVCMIIVNNGAGPENFFQLNHSEWNGLTLCDLVFPFFLFIMGITTYLSLSSGGFKADGHTIAKIMRRTVTILLICWALHWFENVCKGHGLFDFGHLRLTGVLTRIALCYCVVSLLALSCRAKTLVAITIALLTAYGVMLFYGNGYVNGPENINSIVDRFLLPEGHLYTRRPIDPEGLLGTIPAIAHTLIGFGFGAIIKRPTPVGSRIKLIAVAGLFLLVAGLLMSLSLPLNKRIGSPSYVLTSCGCAAMVLAALIALVDQRGIVKPFAIFRAVGANPLFLYVAAEALAAVVSATGAKDAVYAAISTLLPYPKAASLCYALLFTSLFCLAAIPLYRRRIFIKI